MKNNKTPEKHAIGLFVEGQYLHVVQLSLQNDRVKLLDAQILKLAKSLENIKIEKEVLTDVLNDYSGGDEPLELTEELPASELQLDNQSNPENQTGDNSEILQQILELYPKKKVKLGISLAEPQIYYSYFSTDWGLEGKKLNKKILQELVTEKQTDEPIAEDALHVVRLNESRLMALVRENDINILNILLYLKKEKQLHLPLITFIESAEISLVNLVNTNYAFSGDENTVIVNLAHEFSRLIYLRGTQIHNISYIIGAGLDSENINNTIYSRILLEQDNLNIPSIQNIILSGEAYEVGLQKFLEEKLSEEIKIEYLKIQKLDVLGNEPLVSRYAVAIGTAWRTLLEKEEYEYDVDLLPIDIKEGQKKFKLGLVGWLLLMLLPVIAFFSTMEVIQQQNLISDLRVEQKIQNDELQHLLEIEIKLNAKKNQLYNYQNAYTILDSMSVGMHKWSEFLHKLSRTSRSIGQIWVTELLPRTANTATLKGYSLYRNRIPRFSSAIGNGQLKRVEVQEIREHTIYFFEMFATLPDKTVEEK